MAILSKRATTAAFLYSAIIVLLVQFCAPPQYRTRRAFMSPEIRRNIVHTAQAQIGTPYRYGGASPAGFDCSGLAMYVYKKNGIQIPRTASEQFQEGRRLSKRNIQPGDLVFFNINGNGISHVGIYVGRGKFIHAPKEGKHVEYASLKNRYWARKYIGAVSYIN